MTQPNRSDFTTTIIHGTAKNIPKKRITSNPNAIRKDNPTNILNSSSLERKIDAGEVTIMPKLSHEDGHNITNARISNKTNDKCMTQTELANLANQRGGKKISTKDISEIEKGEFVMTHENKLKLVAVKKVLKI